MEIFSEDISIRDMQLHGLGTFFLCPFDDMFDKFIGVPVTSVCGKSPQEPELNAKVLIRCKDASDSTHFVADLSSEKRVRIFVHQVLSDRQKKIRFV